MKKIYILVVVSVLSSAKFCLPQNITELENNRPVSVLNLADDAAVSLVNGTWRYSDAKIAEVNFKSPGPDRKPTGMEISTNDILPKAGSADFDDSKWELIQPSSLDQRRGTGKLSFNWYRFSFIVPERIGKVDAKDKSVYFEVVVDDYAEVWVNGKLNKTIGQKGGSVISGYNSRNRIMLTDKAMPGQKFSLAVFGINGPLSDLPDNYIWIRSAALLLYDRQVENAAHRYVENAVTVISPELNEIISQDAKLEKLAEGFGFTEGPVWNKDGYLLFSDPNQNVIYRYSNTGDITIYKTLSGYAGTDIGEYGQAGSNGLTYDKEGRLTACEHGNRRVTRTEKNGVVTVLADKYQGKRLNSPNDLVYRSDGALYFTDPPYGLPQNFDDERKELGFSGVYCLVNNVLKLVASDLNGPNGIVFSPDEKYIYVSNWDVKDIHRTKVIMRYEVNSDGTLKNGKEFFNMNNEESDLALDGMKSDNKGNLFVAGPDAIYVITPGGKLLGKIKAPEHIANLAWGDDGRSLYITASHGLYKIRLNTEGKMLSGSQTP